MVRDVNGFPIVYYLDVDTEILKKRLIVRNSTRRESEYEITEEMFEMFLMKFGVPSNEEAVEIVRLSELSLSSDVLTEHIMKLSK